MPLLYQHRGSLFFNKALKKLILSNNKPCSRMVLLKEYSNDGFVFYTNSISRKGQQMSENPNVSMLFYWPFVNRQVCIFLKKVIMDLNIFL